MLLLIILCRNSLVDSVSNRYKSNNKFATWVVFQNTTYIYIHILTLHTFSSPRVWIPRPKSTTFGGLFKYGGNGEGGKGRGEPFKLMKFWSLSACNIPLPPVLAGFSELYATTVRSWRVRIGGGVGRGEARG